jgi:MraZ protein
MSPVDRPGRAKQKPLTFKNNKHSGKELRLRTDYFERKLDDKRRLTMPSEIREEFKSGVVITRGFKQYLHLYPKDVWDRDVEAALAGDILDESVADKNVKFRLGKVDTQLDQKQGRVKLEKHHLDYAGINRDVVAVRVGNYWRLMNPEAV